MSPGRQSQQEWTIAGVPTAGTLAASLPVSVCLVSVFLYLELADPLYPAEHQDYKYMLLHSAFNIVSGGIGPWFLCLHLID